MKNVLKTLGLLTIGGALAYKFHDKLDLYINVAKETLMPDDKNKND